MINYEALIQYNTITNALRFVSKDKTPFQFYYFSENSSFLLDYEKLNLKLYDFRFVVVPKTNYPRTNLTQPIRDHYKEKNLIPFVHTQKFPPSKNMIFDPSQYINSVDYMFKPVNYRTRAGLFLKNITNLALSYNGFKKIFVYSIDLDKPNINFVNRKIYPFLELLKNGTFIFDDLLLATIHKGQVRYRLLVKDRKFDFNRIVSILKTIRFQPTELEPIEDDNSNKEHSIKVANNLPSTIKNINQIKSTIPDYLENNREDKDKLDSGKFSQDDLNRIALKSTIYKATGNMSVAKKVTSKLDTSKKITNALNAVDKNFADQILVKEDVKNTSTHPLLKNLNLKNLVNNKSPEHLFDKRRIDFETNLKKDITNSFKVLEIKEIPLILEDIKIEDHSSNAFEVEKSDVSKVTVTLKDKFNKKQKVTIYIPRIDPINSTFKDNGQVKCLINQIILCPISFPKPYDSKFQSSFSTFHINSRRTKRIKTVEIFIGSFKRLPLSIILFYNYGFEDVMKEYDIDYEIKKDKPKKDVKWVSKIGEDKYIYFKNVNTELKEEFCFSFINEKIGQYSIEFEFGTREYFGKLINHITGRIDSTYLISGNLENIVDPVVKQVLINQGLPYELRNIFHYMAERVVEGYAQVRNDLGNQRIRGSEVIVHLLQKLILKNYTTYKLQVMSGNKDVKYEINSTKVLSDFRKSEIVSNMEYANPLEEMSVMTRVTPVGKEIGGIPDERAIQKEGRNLHNSYFGNVDPLDTPEGPNVGITQHLTIDANVTSARGLFKNKKFDNSETTGILSTSSSMIPFVENNDGSRILMGVNQSRQMLPLKNPEPPIVRSGYESILTASLTDNFIKISKEDGKIISVSNEEIVMKNKSGKEIIISLEPVHLKSGSGKDTLSIFKPVVIEGKTVKKGDVLAEGACIKDGSISLGRTLCVAYMSYKGFNYEDGIVISDRLVKEEKLTSLHGIIIEVEVNDNDRVLFISNVGEYVERGNPILRKTIGDLEDLIGFDEDSDDEGSTVKIGQEMIKKSPGGKIVDIEVFCNADENKYPKLKDLILKTRKRYGVKKDQKYTSYGEKIDGTLIKFKIEQELKIGVGDKLTGRYGNKGIISLVEKAENMPRSPLGDPVDIVLNPVGVLNRMNQGQIYETYCGLISKTLAKMFIAGRPKKEMITHMINIFYLLDGDSKKTYSSNIKSILMNMSDKEYNEMVEKIKFDGFIPIIIPPFKSPKLDDIAAALKYMGLETGYHLYIPEYKVKTVNKVPIGYQYISKLEHIGELKIHSRATGPTSTKTMQPTGGKRHQGGQRLGEADCSVIASFNAPMVLSELLGPMSDDIASKNKMIAEIMDTGKATFNYTKVSPAKDLLSCYFISLMLDRG